MSNILEIKTNLVNQIIDSSDKIIDVPIQAKQELLSELKNDSPTMLFEVMGGSVFIQIKDDGIIETNGSTKETQVCGGNYFKASTIPQAVSQIGTLVDAIYESNRV